MEEERRRDGKRKGGGGGGGGEPPNDVIRTESSELSKSQCSCMLSFSW